MRYDDGDIECIDRPRSPSSEHEACRGEVLYRESLTGTGTAIPRCDFHWGVRLDFQEQINRDYPDSPVPPAWFDPTFAGERWNDD